MQQVQRGFRGRLDGFLNISSPISVDISAAGRSVYDFSCFGVDAANKLSDDRYMVFYNQLTSPNREISLNLQQGRAVFDIGLAYLPAQIDKLVFTASIDGGGSMSELSVLKAYISQNGRAELLFELPGSLFRDEKAIIVLEIYRKSGAWRINCVGQGFSGGLSALLKHFGGEEVGADPAPVPTPPAPVYAAPAYAPTPAPAYAPVPAPAYAPTPAPASRPAAPAYAPAPAPAYAPTPAPAARPAAPAYAPTPAPAPGYGAAPAPAYASAPVAAAPPAAAAADFEQAASKVKVSLEKKLAKAPGLVSLAKHVAVSLKKNNLENVVAKVGLVLDASGSMNKSYRDGTVQEIVNRILPLAVQFDDDGELDAWIFADNPMRMSSVNLNNYTTAIPPFNLPKSSRGGWGGFFSSLKQDPYSMTIKELQDKGIIGYCNDEVKVMRQVIDEYRGSSLPAYVVFISDGSVHDTAGITQMMIEASRLPIFWQFVGIRGSDYGILENLDSMQGRFIDNANFFALDDFMSVDKTELYNRLLNEFPSWLREARAKGIIK